MKTNTVAEEWLTYRTLVLPKDCHEIQVRECRRAFYAGAVALFGLFMTMLDPGTEPTEADMAKVDKVDQELKQFLRDVEERRK